MLAVRQGFATNFTDFPLRVPWNLRLPFPNESLASLESPLTRKPELLRSSTIVSILFARQKPLRQPLALPVKFVSAIIYSYPGTGKPEEIFSTGAMCVRLVNDRFVLRFTFLLAVRLGLPRPASQVIHRSELYTE